MTTETKTEARERMDDRCESRFEGSQCMKLAGHQGEHHDPVMGKRWMFERQIEEPASVASLSAALSALRAEHQRVQEQAAAMRGMVEQFRKCMFPHPKEHPAMFAAWKKAEALLAQSDAGGGWVSPEEHQRVVASLEEAERVRDTHWESGERYRKETLSLRSQPAEALRAKDEAWTLLAEAYRALKVAAENEAALASLKSQLAEAQAKLERERERYEVAWKDRLSATAEFERERSTHATTRAALAASEEKAREAERCLAEIGDALGAAGFMATTGPHDQVYAIIEALEAEKEKRGDVRKRLAQLPSPQHGALAAPLKWWCPRHMTQPDPGCEVCASASKSNRAALSSPSAGPASEAGEGAPAPEPIGTCQCVAPIYTGAGFCGRCGR